MSHRTSLNTQSRTYFCCALPYVRHCSQLYFVYKMNNDKKEKLIEIVQQYECIYNPKSKNYKNVSYKSLLWEKIGAALEIEGSKAKDAWRSLRDGYIRHKKTVRKQPGSSRKYLNFTWSSEMSFLDSTLGLRATSTDTTPPQPGSEEPPCSPPRPVSPPSLPRQSSPVAVEGVRPSPPSPPPGPSWLYPTTEVYESPQSLLDPLNLPPTTQLQQPPITILQPSPSPALRPTKKKVDSRDSLDNADRSLDYLKNKRKKEWDDADHLFISYSKSFKKLSVRNQAKIKVALAKLFADAELDEFENNSTSEGRSQKSCQQQPSLMYLSPAYSALSDASAETISIKDEHARQPVQPVLITEATSREQPQGDDFFMVQLTNHNRHDDSVVKIKNE